jgi:hypothetical protein
MKPEKEDPEYSHEPRRMMIFSVVALGLLL